MTHTISSPRRTHDPRSAQPAGGRRRAARARPRPLKRSAAKRRALARYSDADGRAREVIAVVAAAASVLVIDRDASTRGDRRLVAHIGSDEPPENAALVCSRYIDDGPAYRARCRPLTAEDLDTDPSAEAAVPLETSGRAATSDTLVGPGGLHIRLERVNGGMSIPELRWCAERSAGAEPRPCSLRDVVGALESYEPACAITASVLALHENDLALSTTVLRSELRRVQRSPIVLNRALRERVLAAVALEQLSMSEIAIRCRRVKRDTKGNESGETSWLARRLGLLPDAGRRKPTPWVHSDVLALIARDGLGISPREVESP